MHELSIASSVLETLRGELAAHPGGKITAVGLRIGAMAAIDCDSLRFGFEALVRDTEFDPLRLEIEQVPRRHLCFECSEEFAVDDCDYQCPRCNSLRTRAIGGDELDISYYELEEP